MKPEVILQSDVLDIIFENKNKDYGAYALRKNYNTRLIQALGGTCLFVGLFIMLQSMKPADDSTNEPVYSGIMIDLTKKPIELPKDPPKEKSVAKKQVPTIANTTPNITDVPETRVPPVDSLAGRQFDTKTNNIPTNSGGDPGPGTPDPPKTPAGTGPIGDPEPDVKEPLHHADVMPSFNGDFNRFMLRNLRQPENIEEGEKIVVRIRFVVTAEGNIDDVQLIQSGRSDLDEEVLRVVKKMPRWNPGMQAGKNVPVYFYLPVTFVSNAE